MLGRVIRGPSDAKVSCDPDLLAGKHARSTLLRTHELFAEYGAIAWEVQANGVNKMCGVDGYFNEHIKRLDASLVDGH